MVRKPTGTLGADVTVAEFLAQNIDFQQRMGKSQRQIADEIGYTSPNMISMLRSGNAKLPIDKVPAMAKALDVDPGLLFRLAVKQYWPLDMAVISQIFGTVLTRNETEIIEYIRAQTKLADPELTADLKRKLKAAFATT